jgi:hypothetical protein
MQITIRSFSFNLTHSNLGPYYFNSSSIRVIQFEPFNSSFHLTHSIQVILSESFNSSDSFISSHSFQAIYFTSFISSHFIQVIRFKSFDSNHSIQVMPFKSMNVRYYYFNFSQRRSCHLKLCGTIQVLVTSILFIQFELLLIPSKFVNLSSH